MPRTLKINDETYRRLNRLAGQIRTEEGRPASLDAAINHLLAQKRKASLMDFAGTWQMDDDELESISRQIGEVWSSWRIES